MLPRFFKLSVVLVLGLACMVDSKPCLAQSDDPDTAALIEQQKRMADQYGKLNAMNPMSVDSTSGGTGLFAFDASKIDFSQLDPNNLPEKLRWIVPWLKKPAIGDRVKKLATIFATPEMQQASKELAQNKRRNWLFPLFLAYAAVYWLLKRWVLAATDRFLVRVFLRLVLWFVFLTGQFLITYTILGQPLIKVLLAFKQAIF